MPSLCPEKKTSTKQNGIANKEQNNEQGMEYNMYNGKRKANTYIYYRTRKTKTEV